MRSLQTNLNTTVGSAKTFATLVRDILKVTYGSQYSEAWDITGFAGSLIVPRTAEELQPLMQTLQRFLTANSTLEIPALSVTAANAESLFTTLSDNRSAINDQRNRMANLIAARDVQVAALRKRMRGLIDELTQLLDPLDSRWTAFGLNLPGAEETPEIPTHLRVTFSNSNTAAIQWDFAPRAERYRVWKRVVGAEQEFVSIGSPADANLTLENLPNNASVEIEVSAVNNGGESERSEAITVTTH